MFTKKTHLDTVKSTQNILKYFKSDISEIYQTLTYETTGTTISGLVTTAQYQALVVDKNNFRLALAGVGGTLTESYDNGTYVRFTGVGVGSTVFQIQLMHDGHSDYTSLEIPITVVQE